MTHGQPPRQPSPPPPRLAPPTHDSPPCPSLTAPAAPAPHMDIKNILNQPERRGAQDTPAATSAANPIASPAAATTANAPADTHPSAMPDRHSVPGSKPPPARYPFQSSSLPPPPPPPLPTMRAPPPPPPPQQIVYTGPVYQLQPALEVRHLGNAIHYRYAPYSTYDHPRHMDYTVYQEYAEIPRHPYHDAPADGRHPATMDAVAADLPSPPRVRRRHSGEYASAAGAASSRHDGQMPRGGYGYDRSPPSLSRQPPQRRFRPSGSGYSRSYSPPPPAPTRPFRRAGLPSAYAVPSGSASRGNAHEPASEVDGRFLRERQGGGADSGRGGEASGDRTGGADSARDHYAQQEQFVSYVSYRGPAYAPRHAFPPRRAVRDLRTYNHGPHDTPRARRAAYADSDRRPTRIDARASAERLYGEKPADNLEHAHDEHIPRDFDDDFSDDSPIMPEFRARKRQRAGRADNGRRSSAPSSSRDASDNATAAAHEEASDRYSQYEQGFRTASVERDRPRKKRSNSGQGLATLRVGKGAKDGRMRKKGDVIVSGRTTQASSEVWSRNKTNVSAKNLVKQEVHVDEKNSDKTMEEKNESPVSVEDGSVGGVQDEDDEKDSGLTETDNSSSSRDSVVVRVEDESAVASEHDATSSHEHEQEIARRRKERRLNALRKKIILARAADPDEPYPETHQEFSGVPVTAIGDMLQLWEFVNAFSKTLRLSSFPLRYFEQAIVHDQRSTLLDTCIIRLVRAILADRDLVTELGISDATVKTLTGKATKNLAAQILASLPGFLSFEAEDEEEDYFLHASVSKLGKSSDKWAFYTVLEPAERLRIIRELVDYVAMTDVLRECVVDSMEHAEEEKRKAKEENAANRKKLESQLKEMKAELLDYRVKNGLVDPPADSDKEKATQPTSKEQTESAEESGTGAEKEESLSRKQKLLVAKREREVEEDRRVKERGADAIIAKMEKVRTQLKSLKNIRLRNRSGCRDGDLFDGSVASPAMPFTALHEDPVRTHPIGTDREDRCYWFFEGSGRIWIEDTKSGEWCFLKNGEEVEGLIKWLSSYRSNEQQLKKNIRTRKEHILVHIVEEAKRIEAAELEAQKADESEPEVVPRQTRAGKRRADSRSKTSKAKKTKPTGTFLDYRNLEK